MRDLKKTNQKTKKNRRNRRKHKKKPMNLRKNLRRFFVVLVSRYSAP